MICKTKKFTVFEPVPPNEAIYGKDESTSATTSVNKSDDIRITPLIAPTNTSDMFAYVFDSVTTKQASEASLMDRREMLKERDYTLTYGEIDSINPIWNVLTILRDKYDAFSSFAGKGKFYDLGSGTGRPCIAAALTFQEAWNSAYECCGAESSCGNMKPEENGIGQCIGIEILPRLYELSLLAQTRYNRCHSVPRQDVTHQQSQLQPPPQDTQKGLKQRNELGSAQDAIPIEVSFLLGSIFDLNCCDWTDGDIVFANSTCFDASMMIQLHALSAAMRRGSIFISLSTPMHDLAHLQKLQSIQQRSTAAARAKAREATPVAATTVAADNDIEEEEEEEEEYVNASHTAEATSACTKGTKCSVSLPEPAQWRLLFETRQEMSWGCADYYVHVKEN